MIHFRLKWPFVFFKNTIATPQIHTFTYYIPAPPPRSTYYREKEFDQILKLINQLHFKIISINCTPCNSDKQSGMWAMIQVSPLNERASLITFDEFDDCLAQLKKSQRPPSDDFYLLDGDHEGTDSFNQVSTLSKFKNFK